MSGHEIEIPRRAFVEKRTPAEQAISAAMEVVEAAGADVRLTDAVVLLAAAADSVGDFVDGIHRRRYVEIEDYQPSAPCTETT